MNAKNIKTTIQTFAITIIASFGMVACDKGTEPGDTNVGRGDIVEEGSIIDNEGENNYRYSDTTNLEKHYDHADHENHDDNTTKGYGDGAYDGKGDGIDRGDL